MTPFITLSLAAALAGQPSASDTANPDGSAARLEVMKGSVKGYTLTVGGGRGAGFTLQPEPAFRLGKQGGDDAVSEGAIFLWADAVGRPEAAAQVFLYKGPDRPAGEWRHEFTSLSTRPFTATEGGAARWEPSTPGVTFRPVPDAPKPAAAPAQRLSQMRAIARGFQAEDNFWDKGYEILRMLPTPIARYGKAGGTPEDGALFAFVKGTDPEVFLFVEARPGGGGGLDWQYALAPMTCWGLKAAIKGRTVWDSPRRETGNPSLTFYSRSYAP